MMQVWIVNDDGFFIKCDLVENIELNMVEFGWHKPLYKPKWNGEKWIEGATQEEIDEANKIDICLEDKIQLLLTDLEAYKHTYIEFIEYDGSQQRTQTGDRVMILDAQEGLEKGILTEVAWKYPDRYVLIKDSTYFLNMRMAIGMAIEKSYNTEYVLVQEINALTEETVDSYDMKARFDTVFKSM